MFIKVYSATLYHLFKIMVLVVMSRSRKLTDSLVLLALLFVLTGALPVRNDAEGGKKAAHPSAEQNTENMDEYKRYLDEMAKTNPGRY